MLQDVYVILFLLVERSFLPNETMMFYIWFYKIEYSRFNTKSMKTLQCNVST